MTTNAVPAIPLAGPAPSDGRPLTIPQLGFGLYQVDSGDVAAAVGEAIRVGYRHLDTASAYDNEEAVGQAVEACGMRPEIFVTTKLWNSDAQSRDDVLRAFDASMQRLRLDVLDLYLIHWPVPMKDRYVEAWRALVELRASGRVRAIGVSNFTPEHLRRLVAETGEVPSVNQVELHPHLQQSELRAVHAELGIVTEAWSPLKQGGDVLADPVIEEIARKHGRTPAQVVLRWHTTIGNVVIPKSVTPQRIAENFAVFDFALDEDDLARIAALDKGERVGPHPDEFQVGVAD